MLRYAQAEAQPDDFVVETAGRLPRQELNLRYGFVAEVYAGLEKKRQEHTEALNADRNRFEAVIAELIETTNAQQGEYDTLLARMAAVEADAQSLTEQYETQRTARRDAWEPARADWKAAREALESHIQAADALCVARAMRLGRCACRATSSRACWMSMDPRARRAPKRNQRQRRGTYLAKQ